MRTCFFSTEKPRRELKKITHSLSSPITQSNVVQGASAKIFGAVEARVKYYPFGLAMEERSMSEDGYRFGFNGVERDDDILSEGSSTYSFKYRIHNPALGKFFSVDPLAQSYPWNSQYAFAENRVIDGIDLEGLEWSPSTRGSSNNGDHVPNPGGGGALRYNTPQQGAEIRPETRSWFTQKMAQLEGWMNSRAPSIFSMAYSLPNSISKVVTFESLGGVQVQGDAEYSAALFETATAIYGASKLLPSPPKGLGNTSGKGFGLSSGGGSNTNGIVYRADNRPPWEILKDGGFQPRGNFDDLIANTIKANRESNFVSTSTVSAEAEKFAAFNLDELYRSGSGQTTYLYKIDAQNLTNGIDVNNYFKLHKRVNPFANQKEIAFKGGIPLDNVQSVRIYRAAKWGDPKTGKVISNEIPMNLFNKKE